MSGLKQKEDSLRKNESNANKRAKLLLENFIKNQQNELKNLEGRLESGRDEIMKGREEDYKRILAKYRVLKENLEDSQSKEKTRIKKSLKSFRPSSNFFSRSIQEKTSGQEVDQ